MHSFRIPKSCSVFRLSLHLATGSLQLVQVQYSDRFSLSHQCSTALLAVISNTPLRALCSLRAGGEFPASLPCLILSNNLCQPVPFNTAFSKSFYCIHPVARTKTFQVSSLCDSFVAAFKPGTCCDTSRLYLWISVFYVHTPGLIIQPRALKGTAGAEDSSKIQTARRSRAMSGR